MEESREPPALLEEVFLRLPYGDLVKARQVCKAWRWVISSSASFKQAYTDSARVVIRYRHFEASQDTRCKVIDSNNNPLFLNSTQVPVSASAPLVYGGVESPNTSLVTAYDQEFQRLFVCNLFTKKWDEIPSPPEVDNFKCAFFQERGGDVQVVHFGTREESGKVMVLDLGRKHMGWSTAVDIPFDPAKPFLTEPAVLNSSVFCLDNGKRTLMEYNVPQRKLSCTLLTTEAGESELNLDTFDPHFQCCMHLVAWQGKLYLVALYGIHTYPFGYGQPFCAYTLPRDSGELQVWSISTGDGRATLLNSFQTGNKVEGIFSVHVDDDGLMHIHGGQNSKRVAWLQENEPEAEELTGLLRTHGCQDNDMVLLVYNMTTNRLEDVRHTDTFQSMKLAITLY